VVAADEIAGGRARVPPGPDLDAQRGEERFRGRVEA
jgi:hypothetical protein